MALKIVPIIGNSYIISGTPRQPSVGLVVNETLKTAILIDSGMNKSAAKDIDKEIRTAGLSLSGIINTHHHADHCGGNNFFQNKYPDIKIYATEYEKIFIENHFLVPMYLSSGSQTFSFIQDNMFLNAKPSKITDIIPYQDDYILELSGIQLTIKTLPGHSAGMIGIGTTDNVFYCADALFSETVFTHHGLLFHTNIENTLKTLDKLTSLSEQYPNIIMYHGGKADNPQELIKINKEKIIEVKNFLLKKISEKDKIFIDDLEAAVMNEYEKTENMSVLQLLLNKTAIMALLTDLERANLVKIQVQDNKICISR